MLTVVLGLGTALLWGLPDVPLAVAVRNVGATAVLAGSLLIGTVLVAPVGLFVDMPDWTSRGVLYAVITGVLTASAYGIAYNAFARAPVSIVTPIISCEGAAAAAIAVMAGEHLSAGMAILLVCCVLGVVLVGTAGRTAEKISSTGVAMAVVGALVWGLVLFMAGKTTQELDFYWGFFSVRVVATLCLVPWLFQRRIRDGIRCEPKRILIWAAGDTGGNLCFYAAASTGPVALASVLGAQFATFGTLAGVIWLHERLKTHQWVGVAIVIGAVTGIAAITA
jgi:drug/metabolite transporter (DMT)-like permease